MKEAPRFAKIGDRYYNVEHIVAVTSEGPGRSSISTTSTHDQPRPLDLSAEGVMKAISLAMLPTGWVKSQGPSEA